MKSRRCLIAALLMIIPMIALAIENNIRFLFSGCALLFMYYFVMFILELRKERKNSPTKHEN